MKSLGLSWGGMSCGLERRGVGSACRMGRTGLSNRQGMFGGGPSARCVWGGDVVRPGEISAGLSFGRERFKGGVGLEGDETGRIAEGSRSGGSWYGSSSRAGRAALESCGLSLGQVREEWGRDVARVGLGRLEGVRLVVRDVSGRRVLCGQVVGPGEVRLGLSSMGRQGSSAGEGRAG